MAFDDKLDWVGGLFYLNSRNVLTGNINIPSVVFTEDDHFKTKSQSAFLHGDYKLTDRFSVSAGVRYAKDDKTAVLSHPGLIANVAPFEVSETHFDWLASANYQLTDDTMVYVTAATGHRPPGISTVVFTKDQLSSFPGEAMTSYELGLKNEFFDHRLRFNVNGFYMDYSKRLTGQSQFQCLAGPLAGPPPVAVLFATDCGLNPSVPWPHTIAAPAKVTGGEWELTAQPARGLTINWGGGYNHFESGVKTLGQPGYVFEGNFPQPEWNMSAGIQYAIPFLNGTITPRVDAFYESEQTFGPAASNQAPTPEFTIPSHTILNAQLSYVPVGSKWDFTVAAENLTDKYYFYSIFNGSGSAVTGSVAPPRMIFFRMKRDFN
jgi:iron complex outermembrane receptor protein